MSLCLRWKVFFLFLIADGVLLADDLPFHILQNPISTNYESWLKGSGAGVDSRSFAVPDTTSFSNPGVLPTPDIQTSLPRRSCCGPPSSKTTEIPGPVELFATHFIDGVLSDSELRSAFDFLRLSANEIADIFYKFAFKVNKNIGVSDPSGTARMIAEAVRLNVSRLSLDSVVGIYAYTGGILSFMYGALTPENAATLSQMYVEQMRESLNTASDSTPKGHIIGIGTGFIDFLKSNRVFRRDNAFACSAIFASAWYAT